MMSNQIPGVPEGWELVEFRQPNQGDFVINWVGQIEQWSLGDSAYVFPIIRKIEKPATYRPFANAEEFKPHRDRWWYRDDKDGRRHFPPAGYSDQAHGGVTWKHRFDTCFFDDGTPFGVRIDE
jgi:hypothetical protein